MVYMGLKEEYLVINLCTFIHLSILHSQQTKKVGYRSGVQILPGVPTVSLHTMKTRLIDAILHE